MWPFKKKYRDVPESGVEQSWSMFQGEYDGKPLIARANVALKPYAGHPKYSHQVGVAVPLKSPDEHGFPGSDEASELNDIEDRICAELELGNECLFAAAITTGGMREFVFYTRDPQSVEQKLKHLREVIESHTVQGLIKPDEDWGVYRQFV